MDAQATPRPQVAVLAGINGAGKSSSADPILRDRMRMPVFVNADTIARGLNAFDVDSEAIKAGRIMLEHLRELAAKRRSFAFETTLSGRTYADWLKELCAVGYAAHLFYFWLDSPTLAITRVANRVRSGGHHIPDDTVRRRYSRSIRNFLELYRPVVTTWQVYDNSSGGRPRLIAFNDGYFDTVVDPDVWDRFNRSAENAGTSDDTSR